MGAPARGQAAGVTHDGHTLDTLAHALRGMPRDAPILVELPDGRLGRVCKGYNQSRIQPMWTMAR